MSEAVTVLTLTMMTSTVSEESLARDTHKHRLGVINVNIFTVTYNFENEKEKFAGFHTLKIV